MIKKRGIILILACVILILLLYLFRVDYYLFYKTNKDAVTNTINSEDCIELYPSDGKIKIIFIPDYSYISGNTFEYFVSDIQTLLDEEGDNQGLFSIDILNENKQNFDFYYFNKIPKDARCRNGASVDGEGISWLLPESIKLKDQKICQEVIEKIKITCQVENAVILSKIGIGANAGESNIYLDVNFKEKNIVPNYYFISRNIFSIDTIFFPDRETAIKYKSVVFVHELSHMIFKLADLYSGNNLNSENNIKTPLYGCDVEGCPKWCKDYNKTLTNYIISINDAYSKINTGINCTNNSGCYSGCYGGYKDMWRPYIDEFLDEDSCDVMLASQNCVFTNKSIDYNQIQKEYVETFFNHL